MEENQVDEAPKERRRLKLKPRSKDAGTVGGYANSSSRSNPFGAAKPREANLEKKGVDWKKRDADLSKRLVKLPSMSSDQVISAIFAIATTKIPEERPLSPSIKL